MDPEMLRLLALRNMRSPIAGGGQPNMVPDPGDVQDQGILGRLGRGVTSLFSGPRNPNLPAGVNDQAQREAMLHAGLATIMASQPQRFGPTPNALGAIAQGIMAGRGTGAGVRGQAMQQNALQNIQGLTPEQKQMIAALPPEAQAQVLQELAIRKPENTVLGQGDVLLGPDNQPIFTNPDVPDLPADLRAYIWMHKNGMSPDDIPPQDRPALIEQWERLNQSRGDRTTFNVNPGDPNAALQEAIAGFGAGQFTETQEAAVSAVDSLESLNLMANLFDQGLETGLSESALLPLRQLGEEMGIANAEGLAQQELFNTLSNRMVPQIRQQMGNMGQLSDRDLQFLVGSIPRLSNSPGGNRLIIEMMRRAAEQQVEIARLQQEYIEEHGNLVGWTSFRNRWIQQQSNFDDLAEQTRELTGPQNSPF